MVWTTSTCEQSLIVSAGERRPPRIFRLRDGLIRQVGRLRAVQVAAIANGLVLAGFVGHWLVRRSPIDPVDLSASMNEGLTLAALVVAGLATCMLMLAADPASRVASDTAGTAARYRPTPEPPPHRSPPRPEERVDVEAQFVGLMAEMSHELRTPLNVIIGFSDMMQRELLGPLGAERYKSYAGHIRESGFALAQAVDDTLALTRLIARADRDRLAPVGVHAILRNAAVYATPEATEGRVRLILPEFEDDVVQAESAALEQAVANLVQTAVLSAPRDGAVEMRCRRQSGVVVITISTTGPSIAVGGFTATDDEPRLHDASRLRTAIARALIELQGGHLVEHRKPDGSSQCRITLPSGAHPAV